MAKKKILLVDDEKELREGLAILLWAKGFEVFSAGDGEEGLNVAREVKPDLILLDVMMPKMDGYTFAKQIKNEDSIRDTPIIVVTAKDKMEDVFQLEGVKGYLVKPFGIGNLLFKIKEILGDDTQAESYPF
ncbi:MAG: response regulator [Candidatus Omnitrophota bacterium]